MGPGPTVWWRCGKEGCHALTAQSCLRAEVWKLGRSQLTFHDNFLLQKGTQSCGNYINPF